MFVIEACIINSQRLSSFQLVGKCSLFNFKMFPTEIFRLRMKTMAAENISPLNGMFRVANRLHGHYPTSISKASICHRHFRRVSTNWPQLLPIAFKVASFSSFSCSAQVHIEGVSYNCDMCGKTSGSKNGLQQHKAKYHRYLELKSQLLIFDKLTTSLYRNVSYNNSQNTPLPIMQGQHFCPQSIFSHPFCFQTPATCPR